MNRILHENDAPTILKLFRQRNNRSYPRGVDVLSCSQPGGTKIMVTLDMCQAHYLAINFFSTTGQPIPPTMADSEIGLVEITSPSHKCVWIARGHEDLYSHPDWRNHVRIRTIELVG